MIKDQIHCRSQSLLNFRRRVYTDQAVFFIRLIQRGVVSLAERLLNTFNGTSVHDLLDHLTRH